MYIILCVILNLGKVLTRKRERNQFGICTL